MNHKKLLDKFQQIVVSAYEGGEHSHCKTVQDVKIAGDGLLRFLTSELSESEDCENIADALKRLDTIAREIEEVRDAFAEESSISARR